MRTSNGAEPDRSPRRRRAANGVAVLGALLLVWGLASSGCSRSGSDASSRGVASVEASEPPPVGTPLGTPPAAPERRAADETTSGDDDDDDEGLPGEGEEVELDDLGTLEIDGAMIEVDGLLMQEMSCELEAADGMAMVDVVAQLSEHKASFDACAPGGAAYRVAVRWTGDTDGGEVTITAAAGPEAGAVCLDEALSAISMSDYSGRCSALMLIGERAVAEEAATRLMGGSP